MKGKPRDPAAVQKSLVQQVQRIASHTQSATNEMALMLQGLHEGLQGSMEPTADLLSAADALLASATKASATLSDCLNDLVQMGEAMTPVLASSPETAPALLLSFFSTFVTQMGTYYTEMNVEWGQKSNGISRGRAAFLRESPGSSATPSVRTPTNTASPRSMAAEPVAALDEVASTVSSGKRKKNKTKGEGEGREGPGPLEGIVDSTAASAPPPKTGKKRIAAAEATLQAEASPQGDHSPFEDPFAIPQDTSEARRDNETETMTSLAAAAEAGVRTAVSRRPPRKGDAVSTLTTPVNPSKGTPAEHSYVAKLEPPYLQITSTLENALGPVVMASRPSVFSSLATFAANEPVATYFVRLVRPGSLAYFVYCNYIQGDEDTQANFLCDVLETECAEVDPFTSPAGEVRVVDASDLSSMPACAWGMGSSEDNDNRLYTLYALVTQPPRLEPTAIIQDTLDMNGTRDEVLHMVTLVDDAPEFARVTCMVSSEFRGPEACSQKQAAIMSFSRSGFAQAGFVEVPESEVLAALSHVKRTKQGTLETQLALLRGATRDRATKFKPAVQLASLDEPAEGDGISFGGVARGAVQGGLEVLKAPFTVGRAVGEALLGATGVTEAVRNNIEGVFRKSFPDLAAETLIESFNCAWVENSLPKQGYLFITPRWLCFQSTVSSAHFSLEYDEVKDIVKSKSMKVFENAIEIQTHLNSTIHLTSFLQRDQAYTMLMNQWLKQ